MMLGLLGKQAARSSRSLGRTVLAPATAARCSLSSSSSAAETEVDRRQFHPVYVHHVSKTVLQHLQENRAEWLVSEGLDSGLRLNSNGTFVLQFPARKGFDAGRIWTSYDKATKQHWLSVYRQKLVGRFLLKDASMEFSKKSFAQIAESEERVRNVVDQMIESLNDSSRRRR